MYLFTFRLSFHLAGLLSVGGSHIILVHYLPFGTTVARRYKIRKYFVSCRNFLRIRVSCKLQGIKLIVTLQINMVAVLRKNSCILSLLYKTPTLLNQRGDQMKI